MLKGFEEDLAGLELPDEVKQTLIDKANERASGLVSKNQELLSKLTEKKDDNTATHAELEQLRQLKHTYDQEKAESQGKYQEALELAETRFKTELEKTQSQLAEFQKREEQYLINDGLSRALDGVHVDPDLKEAATALLKSQATISEGKAMIGETSLSDYVNEWANANGKRFVLAPNNSGGNATGSQSPTTTNTNKPYQQLSAAEKVAYLESKRG